MEADGIEYGREVPDSDGRIEPEQPRRLNLHQVVLEADGVDWVLRWAEQRAVRRVRVPANELPHPLDEIYDLAHSVCADASYHPQIVTMSINPDHSPAGSGVEGSTVLTDLIEVVFRCANADPLLSWARVRLGVACWEAVASDGDARDRSSAG